MFDIIINIAILIIYNTEWLLILERGKGFHSIPRRRKQFEDKTNQEKSQVNF